MIISSTKRRHTSESGVQNLRGELTQALADIVEVVVVSALESLLDAGKGSPAVREESTASSGEELAVREEGGEASELSEDSVQVREVAVTIIK